MNEYRVKDLVDGYTAQATTLPEVYQAVKRIKEYAEQEGYEPEYQVWVRLV